MNCLECSGECCKRLAIDIDEPETEEDFDDIKWYLYHENMSVYQDEDSDWCVQFETKCKHLDNKGMCKIYEKRPPICREHSFEKCEMNNKDNCIEFFETPKDVDKYIEKLKKEGKLVNGKLKK